MKEINGFARNIRSIRKEFGLSQIEFGEILNTNRFTISNYERGSTIPRLHVLESIVRFAHRNGKKYGYDYLLGLNFDDDDTFNQYGVDK